MPSGFSLEIHRMTPITLTVSEGVVTELQYMVDLHQRHGAANAAGHVDGLVGFVRASVGRLGSWERSMPESMDSLADGDEHQQYRASCGSPRTP